MPASEGQPLAHPASTQVSDDDDGLIFKWARCEYTASRDALDGPKICIMTGRPASMQVLIAYDPRPNCSPSTIPQSSAIRAAGSMATVLVPD